MKSTKKIMLAFVMIALGFVTVQAQRGQGQTPDPEKRAVKQTAQMTEQLSLSEKQAAEVEAINLKYAKLHQEKYEKAKGEREAARQDRQQMHNDKQAELKKVLTDEQFTQLEKLRAERGQGKTGFRGKAKGQKDPEKRAGAMTTRMVDKLGLNDEQANKVRTINFEFAKRQADLRKENKGDRSVMKNLWDEQKEALKKVLTPEQFTEWEKMAPRPGKGHRGMRSGNNHGRM